MTRLIADCERFVPFYRLHWGRAGVDLRRLRFPDDLGYLPPVRKSDLLKYDIEARCDARLLAHVVAGDRTSGSTGEPFEVRLDSATQRRRRWRFVRALMAAGYRPGERLMLVTNPPYPKGARWARWHYVDLREGEAQVAQAYEELRPGVLYGPLSSLLLLARHVLEQRLPFRPRVVVSTAEQLLPAHRAKLAEAFGPKVADFYGMTETGLIAYLLPGQTGYRFAPGLHIEYPTSRASSGEQLLVTDVGGGLMPLIRFDTGDLVRREPLLPNAPVVGFNGRQADCLKVGNRWIAPYEITLELDRIPGLRQFSLEQQADLSLDLYLAPIPGSAAVIELATAAVVRICGTAVQLRVHCREPVAVRPGCKQRYVLSRAAA